MSDTEKHVPSPQAHAHPAGYVPGARDADGSEDPAPQAVLIDPNPLAQPVDEQTAREAGSETASRPATPPVAARPAAGSGTGGQTGQMPLEFDPGAPGKKQAP